MTDTDPQPLTFHGVPVVCDETLGFDELKLCEVVPGVLVLLRSAPKDGSVGGIDRERSVVRQNR